jgi:hypothetical protein
MDFRPKKCKKGLVNPKWELWCPIVGRAVLEGVSHCPQAVAVCNSRGNAAGSQVSIFFD